jgi:APA family basic amino acid/polyamine antiporter
MLELKRSLRVRDGLAMVVGIMVGTGIFRTPGPVAAQLGRPGLTLVAWLLGGVIAFAGSLIFAELATRYPQAGGKYVYARAAFGARAGFVVGWVEGVAIYTVAIAAIGVVSGEYFGRLLGASAGAASGLGVGLVALFTGINLSGVSSGRRVQNFSTAAKVAALAVVIVAALARGHGAGWHGALAGAPHGTGLGGALAVAFQAVIWTYYGYLDAGKIAEEIVEPGRSLPRIFLGGIALVTGLYLLLNIAYLQVLPFDRIAASNLVAADVMAALFGSRAGTVFAALALLVVLASLNGNIFVTPRVIFGLAREGLAPRALARVNRGGTPWVAMAFVGGAAMALAAMGSFELLLALSITLILVVDSIAVLSLLVLRRRDPEAPFHAPWRAWLPIAFVAVYAALFVGTVVAQRGVVAVSLGVLAVAYGWSRVVGRGAPVAGDAGGRA